MRVNPVHHARSISPAQPDPAADEEATIEISTGRSVNAPSDDPVAAALLVENNDQATLNTGYLENLSTINGQLSTADSMLNSVTTSLQRAISLGVQGATGTLSDADRAAVLQELQGIQSQLISLANTSYQGVYIFAGTVAGTPPYVANSNDPSGVTYNGNGSVNQVSVGNGYQIDINRPGSQLFSAPGNSVFLAINSLIQAVQSNTNIPAALGSLNAASNYLSAQHVFYGNAMNQVQSQSTYLNTAKLQLAQQENTLGAADMAAAATNLSQSQLDTQATLAAISKFTQNNLFDYIK